MANPADNYKEEPHMAFNQEEQAILGQAAKLLVNEKLINPEEHLRFLALLKEET